jgi:hypothetical protein
MDDCVYEAQGKTRCTKVKISTWREDKRSNRCAPTARCPETNVTHLFAYLKKHNIGFATKKAPDEVWEESKRIMKNRLDEVRSETEEPARAAAGRA